MKLLNILLKYLQFASVKYPFTNTLIMSSKFILPNINQFANLILLYRYPRFKIKICLLTSKSNFKLCIYRPFIFVNLSHHITTNIHLATQIWKQLQRRRFANAGNNTEFIDFNTQCYPKIWLCGWQKASHCTLVISCPWPKAVVGRL